MAATTTFEGFGVGPILSAAKNQAIGSQKLYYGQQIVSVVTANPIYQIEVSGQVKYAAPIAVALAATSTGILLPAQFTEPATINVSDPLTANAVEVLRHPTTPTIRIVTPIKVGGGTGFVSADKALTGVAGDTIRTSARHLLAPSTLDVQVGGGGDPPAGSPLISIDDLIANMKQASISIPTFNGTQHNKKQAGGYASSYDTAKAIIDDGPIGAYKAYDYMNEVLPWFWAYAGNTHNDSLNLRLQYGWGVISVLRKSTNQWVDSSVRDGTTFDGQVWIGNSQQSYYITDSGDYRDHSDGSRSSRFTGDTGCELWYPKVLDRNLIADSRAVGLIARARIIDNNNNPYYGSGGIYNITLGFDFYGRDIPVGQRQPNGTWGKLIDGFSNRWVEVTNGDWKSIALITMDPYNTNPGNGNTQDYEADFPWCLPPWTMTEAQVRANPPTWTTP